MPKHPKFLVESKTSRQSPNVCKQPLGSLLAGINDKNLLHDGKALGWGCYV